MSISKYVSEQGDGHGGNLFWSAANEFPYRGSTAPMLKETEWDNVEVVQDFHSQEFDLSVKEQLDTYIQIMDRVVNGWYVCYYRDHFRDPTTGNRKVYVEWTQRYGHYNSGGPRGSAISRIG